MALPRFEFSSKFGQYRFYTVHEDDYSSTFFMFTDGDWGHIVGLNGHSFLRHVSQHLIKIMTDADIDYVTFTMLSPLLEKLTAAISHIVEVKEMRKFTRGGREFSFVEIKRK